MLSKALSYRHVEFFSATGIRMNKYLNLMVEITGNDFYANFILAFIGFQNENVL